MQTVPVYNKSQTVTKSDTVDLPEYQARNRLTDAIYAGAGDVVVVFENGATQLFTVPAATSATLPVAARRVNSSLTTATQIIALYAV